MNAGQRNERKILLQKLGKVVQWMQPMSWVLYNEQGEVREKR